MARTGTDDARFDEVKRGLLWAIQDLPGGRVEGNRVLCARGPVELAASREFSGTDGFEIASARGGFEIRASSAAGFLSGILNLAEKLRGGSDFQERVRPLFKSRFYKHEANIRGTGDSAWRGHTYVGDLDEEFWIRYVKTLVRKHFTGLVFYAHYHPFEFFLDYDEFPEAPAPTKRERAATLAGLKRAFGVARAFGLDTFMQHYLTHFPHGLARKHNIVFQGESAGSRLSALDHPVIDKYSRYVYRRTFELMPELSGLYVNFESAPNSGEFLKRTLLPEALRAKTPPQLVFRLWDFNSPKAMKGILGAFPGRLRLAHKVQDRADYYYYPKADPRVIEWKQFFPDTEFMFLVGPCHNCGTVQARQLWCDADFVHGLLADARHKGADSFAFHTIYELLAQDIDARKIAREGEIEMALLNRGHLDAAVDYVRGVTPSAAELQKRLAERAGLSAAEARATYKATLETSQVTLTTFRQFWHSTSEEGYLYPAIRSYYQDPFVHLTPRFVNDEPTNSMTITTAWLNRNLKLRNVPDDTLPIIDFANPAKRRAPLAPARTARKLAGHCRRALAAARKAAGGRPSGVLATLLRETTRVCNTGLRDEAEMRAALELYKTYFSRSRAATVKALDATATHLASIRPYIRKSDPLASRRHLWWHEAETEEDIRRVKALRLAIAEGDFPYPAFAAYAQSIERYNEIRRTVRPNKIIRPQDERLIRRRLGEAIGAARMSLDALTRAGAAAPGGAGANANRRLRRNVEAWLDYLAFEEAGVTPPAMDVHASRDAGNDEGFARLVHDQCFRYGENCIQDLLGFFRGRDWKRSADISFRMIHGREGVTVSLLERGVDVAARRERWKQFRATRSETFFWRVYIDREHTHRRMDIWSILTEGWALFKAGYEIVDRQNAILKTGQPIETDKGRFTHGSDWWRIDYLLPWRLLGGRAAAGESWRFNVTATPMSGTPILPEAGIIGRNEQVIWCPAYEMTAANDFLAGKPERMGTAIFR